MMRTTTSRGRVAVVAGLISALFTALEYFAVSSVIIPPQAGEAVFHVILLPLAVGMVYWGTGRRGLTGLWVIVLVLWITLIISVGSDNGWSGTGITYFVPERAVAWSLVVLPLTVFSVWVLYYNNGKVLKRDGLIGPLAWVALTTAGMTLARYAPDVGSSPRQDPWIALPLELIATICPFVLGGWFVVQLRRPSATVHDEP